MDRLRRPRVSKAVGGAWTTALLAAIVANSCAPSAVARVDAGLEDRGASVVRPVMADASAWRDAAALDRVDAPEGGADGSARDAAAVVDGMNLRDAGALRDTPPSLDVVRPVDVTSPGARRFDPGPDPFVGRSCPAAQLRCPVTAFRDEPAAWHRCTSAVGGQCPAPDIIIRREWIADDTDEPTPNLLRMTLTRFRPNDPEVAEGCVRGIGFRRLLRFNFTAMNIGNGPLNLGRPDENDPVHWEFFTAHGHFHARGWGDYALRTLEGADAVRGRKQSFCLEDNVREEGGDPARRRYPPPLCELFSAEQPYEDRPEFGLSPLWGDEYPSDLSCQWLDVGPERAIDGDDYVPDGIYNLVVAVNVGDRTAVPLYRESNYANNTASIRVELRAYVARRCADNAGDACPGSGARRTCEGACP
jgi:hypothetical protein